MYIYIAVNFYSPSLSLSFTPPLFVSIQQKGIIVLQGASVGIPGSEWVELKWYEFTILTASGRMYPMRVESRTERDEWRMRIAESVRRVGGIVLNKSSSNATNHQASEAKTKNSIISSNITVESFSVQACLQQQEERDQLERKHSKPHVLPSSSSPTLQTSPSQTSQPQPESMPPINQSREATSQQSDTQEEPNIMDSSVLGSFHSYQDDGIYYAYKPRIVPPPPIQSIIEEEDDNTRQRMVQFPENINDNDNSNVNDTPNTHARKRAQTSLESPLMFDDWMINAGLQTHIELFKQNNIYTLRDIVSSPLIDEEGFLVYQIG